MAPVHDLFGSERPLHLDSRAASRRLDPVSLKFGPDGRGASSLPAHSTSDRELADKLGCSDALADNLPTSGFRKSSVLPLPVVESDDLGDQNTISGAASLDAGDFYDVTPAALVAAGSLPEIRVDGPFGAPTQDVFNAEGERQQSPLFCSVTRELVLNVSNSLPSRRPRRRRNRHYSVRVGAQEHLVRSTLRDVRTCRRPRTALPCSSMLRIKVLPLGTCSSRTASVRFVAYTSSGSSKTRKAWAG